MLIRSKHADEDEVTSALPARSSVASKGNNPQTASTSDGGLARGPTQSSSATKSAPGAWGSNAWGDTATWGFGDLGKPSTNAGNSFDFGFAGLDGMNDYGTGAPEPWQVTGSSTGKDTQKLRKSAGASALTDLVGEAKADRSSKITDKDGHTATPSVGGTTKDKMGSKKAGDSKNLPSPPTAMPSTSVPSDADIWAAYIGKGDTGQGRQSSGPAAPVEATAEDIWGGYDKKDKKKGKNGVNEPTPQAKPDANKSNNPWSAATSKDRRESQSNPFAGLEGLDDLSLGGGLYGNLLGSDWMNPIDTNDKNDKRNDSSMDVNRGSKNTDRHGSIWPGAAVSGGGSGNNRLPDTASDYYSKVYAARNPSVLSQTTPAIDAKGGKSTTGKDVKTSPKDEKASVAAHRDSTSSQKAGAIANGSISGSSNKVGKGKSGRDVYIPPAVPDPPKLNLSGSDSGGSVSFSDDSFSDDDIIVEDWAAHAKDGKNRGKTDAAASKVTTTAAVATKVSKLVDSKTGGIKKAEPPKAAKDENATAKGFWGSLGGSTTTPALKGKTIKEVEAERRAKEEAGRKEREAQVKAVGEAEAAKLRKGSLPSKQDVFKAGVGEVGRKTDAAADKSKAVAAAAAATVSAPADAKKATNDAWSFWGVASKVGTATAAAAGAGSPTNSREINPGTGPANHKDTRPAAARLPDKTNLASSKTIKTAAMAAAAPPASTSAAKAQAQTQAAADMAKAQSVADKVRAMQAAAGAASQMPAAVHVAKPAPPATPTTAAGTDASKTKAASKSAAKQAQETGKAVPGGFPAEEPPPRAAAVPSDKSKKAAKTTDPRAKAGLPLVPPQAPDPVPLPPPPSQATNKHSSKQSPPDAKKSSRRGEPTKLPTPPPEPELNPKTIKKERPRVVRDPASSSWGFWAAAPKQNHDVKRERKVKDDTEIPSSSKRSTAPTLSRSMSARKAGERDAVKPSRTEDVKRGEARPSKPTRGMSLSSFFGGAPAPARSSSTRHPPSAAKRASHLHQAPPSPPLDDEMQFKIPDKAAKVMGIDPHKSFPSRSRSLREEQKSRATPGPYAFDDSDGPATRAPPLASQPASKNRPTAAPPSAYQTPKPSRQQDTDTQRPPLRRNSSSAQRSDTNRLSSIFGSLRRKERKPSPTTEADEARRQQRRERRAQEEADTQRREERRARRQREADATASQRVYPEGDAATRQQLRDERHAREAAAADATAGAPAVPAAADAAASVDGGRSKEKGAAKAGEWVDAINAEPPLPPPQPANDVQPEKLDRRKSSYRREREREKERDEPKDRRERDRDRDRDRVRDRGKDRDRDVDRDRDRDRDRERRRQRAEVTASAPAPDERLRRRRDGDRDRDAGRDRNRDQEPSRGGGSSGRGKARSPVKTFEEMLNEAPAPGAYVMSGGNGEGHGGHAHARGYEDGEGRRNRSGRAAVDEGRRGGGGGGGWLKKLAGF